MADRDEIIGNMDIIIKALCDTTGLEQKLDELQSETTLIIQMTQELVSQNAREVQDQTDYPTRYDSMVERYEALRAEEGNLKSEIEERTLKAEVIRKYICNLAEQKEVITEFDSDLWSGLVDFVTVYSKEDIKVTFKDGTEIKA